eukprot:scaffold29297_cov101-Isochrysis_galbana.AAC.2
MVAPFVGSVLVAGWWTDGRWTVVPLCRLLAGVPTCAWLAGAMTATWGFLVPMPMPMPMCCCLWPRRVGPHLGSRGWIQIFTLIIYGGLYDGAATF